MFLLSQRYRFIFLVTLMLFATFVVNAQVAGHPRFPKMNQNLDRSPYWARFFTESGDRILRGDKDGIKLINMEDGSTLSEVLSGSFIKALNVEPMNRSEAFTSTSQGEVYRITIQEGNLKADLINLQQASVGQPIIQFLYNPKTRGQLVAMDANNIYVSPDNGNTWKTKKVSLKDPKHLFRFIMPSIKYDDLFLISTTQDGRYLCSWDDDKIREVPELAIPHGHRVRSDGKEFVLQGKNAQIFGFMHLGLEVFDAIIIRHKGTTSVYAAGVGHSPIEWRKKKRYIYIYELNPRLTSTFSVDAIGNEIPQVLLTAPDGMYLSSNGGKDWRKI